MMASSTLIQVGDGTVECLASNIFKGDKIYNPLTSGFSEVSAVLNRAVCFHNLPQNKDANLAPVRIKAGAINGKFPSNTVLVSQNATILYPERLNGSSITRITAVKAASLVGRPGIEFDEEVSEVIFTKIVLATPGLISISGLILEPPTLSLLNCEPTQGNHPPFHMPCDNHLGSQVHKTW